MRLRNVARAIAVLAVVSIVAAACGGKTKTPTATSTGTSKPIKGGSIVVGAEQWPECVNPINECSSATWTWYSVLEQVLGYAMVLDLNGNFVASPLLSEAPTLDNGGITQNPFTITYKISDKAVWADGTPITSADFDFTWKAILNTTGAYTTVGYTSIDSIDTSDPKTAVIKFKDTFVDWPDLFGGVYQGIFEKAAFPKEANSAKPNLAKEMQNEIPFSGGPWILKSWSTKRAVLVRNPLYFGTVPYFNRVKFVPKTDQLEEVGALLRREVQAIYPGPEVWPLVDQAKGLVGTSFRADDGIAMEALWFNAHERPLNDPLVREALMYAVNRQKVVDDVAKPLNPAAEVLNCGFLALPDSPWCRTRPFERFTYDPSRAVSLLEQAGYDCSKLPCQKNAKPLEVRYITNPLRVLETTTQAMIIKGARAAGFRLKVVTFESVPFFLARPNCPFLHMAMTECTTIVPPDPSITARLSCGSIPALANQYAGMNQIGWCNQQADSLMKASDRELDPTRRLALLNRVYELEASDMVGLPLFVVPATVGWRTDMIAGPIWEWNSSPYSAFFNMNEWYMR